MKTNFLTLLLLILFVLESCIGTINENSSNVDITVQQDTITPLPTIDEIIEHGTPNDTAVIKDSISYETEEYSVIEGVINPGQAISNILREYNIIPTDIYKLEQASKEIFNLRNIQSGKGYTVICSKDSNKIAQCFVYQKSKKEYVVFDFSDSINVYKEKK